MTNIPLTLYHAPGACSRVTVCALNWAELDYKIELVNLYENQQQSRDYLAISPLGKVPLLMIDNTPLAENAAILTYVAARNPGAGLFPSDPSPLARAEAVGGMAFCGGTLHPQIRGIANPQRLTTGEIDGVRAKSLELATKSFEYAEKRLLQRGWWLGECSIIDVYLDWAFSIGRFKGIDATPFPSLDGLEDRLMELPAYERMQEDEARFGSPTAHQKLAIPSTGSRP